MLPQQRHSALGCRVERGEKETGTLKIDTAVKASVVELWSGCECQDGQDCDLTLIKFKAYNQQSGDYSSFFPLGNSWAIP